MIDENFQDDDEVYPQDSMDEINDNLDDLDNERDLYSVLSQDEEVFWLNSDGTWTKDTLATEELAKEIVKIYNAKPKEE